MKDCVEHGLLYPFTLSLFFIMSDFDEKLKNLLKTETSFCDKDWELLEWKLQDSARNADEKLIKLLITDEEMKNKFFSEIAPDIKFLMEIFLLSIYQIKTFWIIRIQNIKTKSDYKLIENF